MNDLIYAQAFHQAYILRQSFHFLPTCLSICLLAATDLAQYVVVGKTMSFIGLENEGDEFKKFVA